MAADLVAYDLQEELRHAPELAARTIRLVGTEQPDLAILRSALGR
jgi:hypothetical protein